MRVFMPKFQLTFLLIYSLTIVSVVGQETDSDASEPEVASEPITTTATSISDENGSAKEEDSSGSKTTTDLEEKDDTNNEDTGGRPKFIVPHQISKSVEGFVFRGQEYVIVQEPLVGQKMAELLCKSQYKGKLSIVNNIDIANFLAEVLAETDLELNSLWIGAIKISKPSPWIWLQSPNEFDQALYDELVCKNPKVPLNDTVCLAFGRSMHLNPQFRPLNCKSRRSFICETTAVDEAHITHPGWIQLSKQIMYKIFFPKLNWNEAEIACSKYNINATLAYVKNLYQSDVLGRYLLIGRPSFENAWIDGKWNNYTYDYEFTSQGIHLNNVSNEKGYPPWNNNRITKIRGCLLLDRHITNHSYFVEARCDRRKPYICSISKQACVDKFNKYDYESHNKGYRIIYDKKSWTEAYSICSNYYKHYNGYLTIVANKMELFNLLYGMGERHHELNHVWVAGKFRNNMWKWLPTDEIINLVNYNFVLNSTYLHDIEQNNVCLNMDRENHMSALFYGTDCNWRQAFICTFDLTNFRNLLKDESSKKTEDS